MTVCVTIVLVVWPPSPTVAVIREAFLSPVGSGLPAEFRVRQSTPIGSGMTVYYTYRQTDLEGKPGECEFVSYVKIIGFGWQIIESYGGCLPVRDDSLSFTADSRYWDIPSETPWSEIHGEIKQKDVDWVRVSWSDGSVDTASTAEGHFLIVRSGDLEVVQIEAIDQDGETIVTQPQFSRP
jgi:hypothetical protein